MMDPRDGTSDDVHRLQRRTLALMILFALAVTVAGWYFGPKIIATNKGVQATKDSINLQILTNIRSACITDRRTAESRAQGELDDARTVIQVLMNQASLPPDVVAAFAATYDDSFTVTAQYRRVTEAIKTRREATSSLDPSVLNQPPPIGCGPPAGSKGGAP